jgi:hypothetical protein
MRFDRIACALAATILALAAGRACAQTPGMPLDPLPHELHPNDWPQPDYFTEALKLTHFQPGERWRALKLASGIEPAMLVLPVQMEAFGWSPAFAALVGARLDHELAARGIVANRQTDLFDADGPYVRRFADADIAAFSAAHANAPVVALYVGRDGAGKDFVTLTLRRGDQLLRAHRTFAEDTQAAVLDAAAANAVLDAFAANLPALLDELGLKSAKVPPPASMPRACAASDWSLADLTPASARSTRACHALVMGVLLPEFDWEAIEYPRVKTADKLAWLAEAWVEADALAPESAKAARAVAWSQLELPVGDETERSAVDSADPVARALARALWAWARTRAMPVAGRNAALDAYALAAATALPPFTRAVFIERAEYDEQFRPVQLCRLEAELPAMRMPADCADVVPARRTRPATHGEHALLEAWRIAQAYKAVRIEGENRHDPEARQAALDAMPARIAAHPIVRMERFSSDDFDKATGSFESLVAHAKAAATDFVQATADLQRWNSTLSSSSLQYSQWTTNEALRAEPGIRAITQDETRVTSVLRIDGFMARHEPLRARATSTAQNFLRPGPPGRRKLAVFASAPASGAGFTFASNARPVVAAAPAPTPTQRVAEPFPASTLNPAYRNPAVLEQAAANAPTDLEALTAVAVLRLKTGQSVAQVRALIDARPDDRRAEQAVGESQAWAEPESAFYLAGELEAARIYATKVAKTGSYSAADLQARARLKMLAGDIPGALQRSRERLDRYENDFSRRDLAGLEFMRGRADAAWATLAPRLTVSDQSELWVGAEVGQRIEGRSARAAYEWVAKSGYGHAKLRGIDIGAVHALRLMTDDRTPGPDDLALLAEFKSPATGRGMDGADQLQILAQLKQLAVAPHPDPKAVHVLRDRIAVDTSELDRGPFMALYAWAAWQASDGADPSLAPLRATTLAQDFDALLAKGVLLGLDKQPGEALRYLRAARFDLVNTIGPERRDVRSAPYSAAFVAWLLFNQTHDTRYRDEALLLARAHQRTFPYLAWPYALDALLSPAGPARDAAACRAAFLDRGSLFLSHLDLKPDAHGKACAKFLW